MMLMTPDTFFQLVLFYSASTVYNTIEQHLLESAGDVSSLCKL